MRVPSLPASLKSLLQGAGGAAHPSGDRRPTPPRLRGRVRFDPQSCSLCRVCARVCPSGAIQFGKRPDGLEFVLRHDACVFCGLCALHCESKGLHATSDWHLTHLQSEKDDFLERVAVQFQKCSQCGKQKMPSPVSLMTSLYPGLPHGEIERLRAMCPRCRKADAVPGCAVSP